MFLEMGSLRLGADVVGFWYGSSSWLADKISCCLLTGFFVVCLDGERGRALDTFFFLKGH